MFMVIHEGRPFVVYNELASEILQMSADSLKHGEGRDIKRGRKLMRIALNLEQRRIDEGEARNAAIMI